MATRVPPVDSESDNPATAPILEFPGSAIPGDTLKHEESPAPSRMTSADAETTTPSAAGGDVEMGTGSTAGRKRKLNSTSARGVANLNPDQLAKKRANDRQAQRAIRERTKSHIDALEQQVRDLSSQKPFMDLQAALKQNEAVQAENREIRQGLKAAMDILTPLLGKQEVAGKFEAAPPSNCQTKPVQNLAVIEPFADGLTPNSQRSATVERSYTESIASVETPSPTHSAPTLGGVRRDSTNGAASFRSAFDYQRHNLTHGLDFGTDERVGFNFLLDAPNQVPKVEGFRRSLENLRPSHLSPPSICTPPLNPPLSDQNLPAYQTPIRNISPTCPLDAILLDFLHNRQREAAQGVPSQKLVGPPYPSVSSLLNPEKSVYSHPVSKVLTDILRTFPDISSIPEQVAVLYLMFLNMRWQIYPTPENYDRLPEWLTPRPSQLLTPHPAWIDYLPWPLMRDRLVMSYQDYPFENWFVPFTRTLSVNWPYEATDCLLATSDCDDLIINPVFERHFRNINNWSLGPAFAEAYPALVETTRIKQDAAWPS